MDCKLSAKETQVLSHLRDGSSNKKIACKLDITEATVKVHVKAILRKIGVTIAPRLRCGLLSACRDTVERLRMSEMVATGIAVGLRFASTPDLRVRWRASPRATGVGLM